MEQTTLQNLANKHFVDEMLSKAAEAEAAGQPWMAMAYKMSAEDISDIDFDLVDTYQNDKEYRLER